MKSENSRLKMQTEAKYKKQIEAMAAEYEAKIAEIQNQKKDDEGNAKEQNLGKSTKNVRKKGNTVICNTMEEAMRRIQEEMNKAAAAAAKCGELLMKAFNYAKAERKGLIKYTEDGRY